MLEMWHNITEYLKLLNTVSILVRILLAAVGGSLIGLNRRKAGQPAGMRTHMLVCIGAALVMLTGQYSYELYGQGDPTRLGAQVISGIGFLGAGSIIISGKSHNNVKGLTTAAGLWGSACIGLAVGIGFYSAAIITTIVVTLVLSKFKNLEQKLILEDVQFQLYMEVEETAMAQILQKMTDIHLEIEDLSVIKKKKSGIQKVSLSVHNTGKGSKEEILRKLEEIHEIQYVKYTADSKE